MSSDDMPGNLATIPMLGVGIFGTIRCAMVRNESAPTPTMTSETTIVRCGWASVRRGRLHLLPRPSSG